MPKSVTPARIQSNFQGEIYTVDTFILPNWPWWETHAYFWADFVIPDEDFEALNKLDRGQRYNFPFRWGKDIFGEIGDAEAERRAEEFAAEQRAKA